MKALILGFWRISCLCIIGLVLFFPGGAFVGIQRVDWQREMGKRSSPIYFSGAAGALRRLREKENPINTVDDLIQYKTRGEYLSVSGENWMNLYAQVPPADADYDERTWYCSLDDVPKEWLLSASQYVAVTAGTNLLWLDCRMCDPHEYSWSNGPSPFKYPLRKFWPFSVVAAMVLWWLSSRVIKRITLFEKTSTWSGFVWGWALTGLSAWLMFAPSALGYEKNEAMPVCFIGGFIGIAAIITFAVIYKQARLAHRMLESDDILVHWTYSPEEWMAFVEEDRGIQTTSKRRLAVFLGAIMLVVGLGFVLVMRDEASVVVFAGLMIFYVALLLFVAWMTRSRYHKMKSEVGEVIIAHDGLYLNGEIHDWQSMGSKLEGVGLSDDAAMLMFTYSYISRYGRQKTSVAVPVPAGARDKINIVFEAFENPDG